MTTQSTAPLLPTVPVVRLIDRGERVVAPEGVVYSTNPRSCVDAGERSFVVKGPDPDVVISELIAYGLAGLLQVRTPTYAVATIRGDEGPHFASRKAESAIRDVSPFLEAPTADVTEALVRLHVLDVWVANEDRNVGGLLFGQVEDVPTSASLIAIDFEKSHALRGTAPLIQVNSVEPKRLRPKAFLGDVVRQALRRCKPDGALLDVGRVGDHQLESVVRAVANTVGSSFGWADSVYHCLKRRRETIGARLSEVWT